MNKKWLICVVVLVCVVLLFTGCPKVDEPDNPPVSLETGDIVLKNGQVIRMENLTEQQKLDAVGVIYMNKGVPFVLGKYNTLGSQQGLAWAKNDSTGYNTCIDEIMCHMIKDGEEKSNCEYSAVDTTFTGDTDGSDNWSKICNRDPEGTADSVVAENYPAFNWVNSYAATYGLTGTDFEDGWYMPSVEELCILHDNRSTLDNTLDAINGNKLATGWYWSSCQSPYGDNYAWIVAISFGGCYYNGPKSYTQYVCCVRRFN